MIMRWVRRSMVAGSFILLFASLSAARQGLRIAGRVADAKGVAVPGAGVRLFPSSDGPPIETLTDVDGTFRFEDLSAGSYRMTVEMEGFERLELKALDPSSELNHDLRLTLSRSSAPRPGAGARPAAASESRRPGEENVFREVELSSTPIDRLQQGTMLPEIEANGTAARPDESGLLVITGNPTASVDAGNWNDPNFRARMMDMARQMGFGREGRIQEGRFGGQGGRGAGGGPMGGRGFGGFGGRGRGAMFRQSRINGSVNSIYGNSVFNARPFSLTGEEVDKPLRIRNSFGASIGGPLPWASSSGSPGGMRRGRRGGAGMWFVSYSGIRNRNPFDVLTTVPTALERSGDFSQTSLRAGPLAGQPVTIYDPSAATPTQFPGDVIPPERMDPAAVALLGYIPLPNLPGDVQNFTMQRGLIQTNDQFTGRFNTPLSSKANGFVNYSFRRGGSVSSAIFPGLDTDRTNRGQNVGLGGMYRIQPRLILNLRATVNRVRVLGSNAFAYTDDVAGRLGIMGVSREPIDYGIPNIDFTNYGDLALGPPSLNRNQNVTIGGSLARIGTGHSIQAGGSINWIQNNITQNSNARGIFDFTGYATSAFDSSGYPIAGTGYDLADFLLGLPYSTSRRYGGSTYYLRGKSLNLFVQDNWRARANLTISIGLRYEYIQPFYEKYDRIVMLDAAPGFTAVAQVFPGGTGPWSGSFPRSLLFSDTNNFAPRFGIAWKPTPSSRWVIRSGYGIFYNPSVYSYIAGQLIDQPPFAINQDILTSSATPLTLRQGFPVEPDVTILNTYAVDPYYGIGYVQQWNLNLQTRLFRLYALEIGYNGAKGTGLDILRAPNRAPSGSTPGSTEDNRVIGDAGNFVYQENGADSILHALTVRVTRRFSGGFRLSSSYTLGKSIDDASGIGGGRLVVIQDENNPAAERALSSFDRRHRLENAFSIDLPFGQQRRFLAGAGPGLQKLISGWTLNGTWQLLSGMPLTARILGNVSNNSGTGSNNSERADSTGISAALPGAERTTTAWLNTAAFAIPAPGQFGNAGRNTIPGPGTDLLNLVLRKSFRLDENNRRLDLGCQITNVLNHPNYSGVGTIVNALDFGRVTSVGAMRQVQFNLRISF